VNTNRDKLLDILNTHGAELYALLTRLTMRADVAEDLLQELFLKLRAAKGFAAVTNQEGYAFRTAMHLAFDWRRAQRPIEQLRTEPASAAESPLDNLIDAEELEQVLDAMQHLSELSRQALILRYLQHHEYGEIAAQLGKTEHQVRGLCHKGITVLRTMLRSTAR
jgi:RNA polymerase sigma factor (sigma-70 family)